MGLTFVDFFYIAHFEYLFLKIIYLSENISANDNFSKITNATPQLISDLESAYLNCTSKTKFSRMQCSLW